MTKSLHDRPREASETPGFGSSTQLFSQLRSACASAIPVALFSTLILDRFIAGFTLEAVKG